MKPCYFRKSLYSVLGGKRKEEKCYMLHGHVK